jgi:DNA invertase Pin-like site-specific DNA recombinase
MLLDMLAAVARKDYTDRRRRQAQGIEKAKTQGLYRGRRVDTELHARITELLAANMSWSKVCEVTKASRSTVLRVVNAQKVAAEDAQAA